MSMDRKKSKYLSETKFWAFGSLKAEKTRWGHNGPPPCGYVIPDPMWKRVKNILHGNAARREKKIKPPQNLAIGRKKHSRHFCLFFARNTI